MTVFLKSNNLIHTMNNFLWVLKFLTVIPIDKEDKIKPDETGPIVFWFPVAGLCIGVFLSAACVLFYFLFPALIVYALVIIIYIIITGALHLDGYADTCDGIWGGYNREKRLEIMRDSRIGSFGATGLICLLGLRYVSLLSIGKTCTIGNGVLFPIVAQHTPSLVPSELVNTCIALLIMPVVGRWGQIYAAGLSMYARNESGTGGVIVKAATVKQVICASLFLLCFLFMFYHVSGLMIFAIISAFTLLWIWYMKKKINGMTGDTLGATNEILELLFLLCLLLVNR
ncbi:MAG: adenosylcobinamide-GDP ribazoletransferase [Candidatus Loosdrechtia sp.]|uniref:adenosylcobinamide-GDP ribazoletransferase n=1 Tax=Candidatus Loosdrechtia sp. TaxID=3101272 RepID=UPI003A6F20A0|nr:MAG: adenosylcobinamide-GDP ribazoletransferase [Candidatus Jettenia sp. AMX2]